MAQFTNQATVSYNGMTVNSNIVTGEITQVLSADKAVTAETYRTGDTLTYVISIRNAGITDYTGLRIVDNLGAYTSGTPAVTRTPLTYTDAPGSLLYYVDGVLQATPTVTAGPPLTIENLTVPAGSNAILIYRVQVNEFAPLGEDGTIANTATIGGSGVTEPITVSTTVSAETSPMLSIFKSLCPTTVVENGQINYTFTIQNTGSAADADAGVVISDVFTPILDAPLTVTLNGAALPEEGNYTYDATTGAFATVAGAITIPAATYAQDPTTGVYVTTPGVTVLTVSGTL